MALKISKEDIHIRLTNLFPLYEFDLAKYKNTTSKIKVVCDKNHISERIVKNILQGHGCNECGNIKSGIEQRRSLNDVLDKFYKVHGQNYDYTKYDYKNNKTSSIIICPIHGDFEQSYEVHSKGHGCPSCSGNKRLKSIEFIERSNQVHSHKYDYGLVVYKNMHTKVKIVCPTHGIFEQLPMHHIKGVGCVGCNQSKGERIIENILKENNIQFIPQMKFDGCIYQNQLLFDFYLPDYNICVEFNGIQHYSPVELFGGMEEHIKVKMRDKIKFNFCKENNIKLMVLKHKKKTIDILDINKITKTIKKILNIR